MGAEYHSSETTEVNATYLRVPPEDASGSQPLSLYRVKDGQGSGAWNHEGTSINCHASGKGTYELTGGIQTYMFVFNNATDRETGTEYVTGDRAYVGLGSEGLSNLDKLK